MPEFGILQAMVLIVLLILMIGASARISRLWREEAVAGRIFKTMRSWWFWGDALLRGWIRALPAGLAAGRVHGSCRSSRHRVGSEIRFSSAGPHGGRDLRLSGGGGVHHAR